MNATANILWVAVVLGAMAMAVAWGVRRPLFNVHAIRVEGEVAHNSVSTIRANAGPGLAGNLFTIDLGVAKRAFESVPWVRTAIVRRVWPNQLAVQLEEHRAAALWGDERLLNTYGEVFEANLGDVEDDELPVLRGPDNNSRLVLTLYQRLVPEFEKLGARIDALTLSARGSWRVELDDGAEVQLGRGSADEVLERAARFVQTVSQVTAQYQRPLEYADLRHADGYAVRLKGIATNVGAPQAKPARRRSTH